MTEVYYGSPDLSSTVSKFGAPWRVYTSHMGTQDERGYIGDWLKSRLKTVGKTQRWLSKEADIAETTISDLANNKIELEAEMANRLSAVTELGVTAAQLLSIAGKINLASQEAQSEDAGLFGGIYTTLSEQRKQLARNFLLMLHDEQKRSAGDNKPGQKGRT